MKVNLVAPLLLGLMPACNAATPPVPPAAESYIVLGFYSQYLAPGAAFNSLQSYSSHVNAISTAVFVVDATGSIGGSIANSLVIPYAKAHGMRVYASVSNTDSKGFSAALGHSALTATKAAVIGNLLILARKNGFDGIDIDFENLDPKDRAAYSSFVHDLAAALHSAGLKLILSVPAKASDDPTNSWSGAIDYAAIGRDADLLQLMSYDEHFPGYSAPGPVAGSDWVEACIRYAGTVVAPSKLLLGLPAYGYDWEQKSDGAWVAGNANYHGAVQWTHNPTENTHWDKTSNSPFADYTDGNGLKHETWYENSRSIAIKTKLVKQYHLAGLAMWEMGEEDLGFWQAVKAGLK